MQKPFEPKFILNEEVFYTPDYGMTGELAIIVSLNEEQHKATIRYDVDSEAEVPMLHLYTRSILQDW